jgi:hypothetical protein
MATSSAVPSALRRAADTQQHWAGELSAWVGRLASLAYPAASVADAARRVGALAGRTSGHAAWTRGVVGAFEAADRRLAADAAARRPRVWLPPLPLADAAGRVALLRAMALGGTNAGNADLSWLVSNRAGRYLRVDPRHDGRVVEVLGDLDTAKHVVILVPGMSNDLHNYRTSLRTKATALLDAMRAQTGDGVVVVAWLGYDTPDLGGASRSDVAEAAAPALVADVAAIRNSYPAVHVTVVAHSYGSVVLGQAMKQGLDAPTAVVVGSPGMDGDDRDDLGSRNTTLWAAKSTSAITVHRMPFFGVPLFGIRFGDPVALAPVHGEDPSAKGFGARHFGVGDVAGHGEYFEPGTLSVQNIARIAVSQPAT